MKFLNINNKKLVNFELVDMVSIQKIAIFTPIIVPAVIPVLLYNTYRYGTK